MICRCVNWPVLTQIDGQWQSGILLMSGACLAVVQRADASCFRLLPADIYHHTVYMMPLLDSSSTGFVLMWAGPSQHSTLPPEGYWVVRSSGAAASAAGVLKACSSTMNIFVLLTETRI